MKRTMKRAAVLAVAGVASLASVGGAATIENGVVGLKLIMLDKYGLGKAKVVYVAKGASGIQKGPGGDPPGLTGTVEVFPLSDPTNKASYALSDWLVNKSTVAKYVNKAATPGDLGAKVAVIKPGLVGKLVAKNLGDGDSASGDQSGSDLDLQALVDTDTIRVVVTVDNANDGDIYVFCSDFSGLSIKKDGSDANFKVLSKSSTAPGSCSGAPPTTSTTTTTLPGTCPISYTFTANGSDADVDHGWQALSHDNDVPTMSQLTLALGACANPSPPCGPCTVTGVIANAGVFQNRRCRGDATGANGSWLSCLSDTDCPGIGNGCVFFFGPPRPGDKGFGVLCTTTEIGAAVTGTVDADDGTVALSMPATFRTYTSGGACPQCVAGVCNDGPRSGMPCTVQGTSTSFSAAVSLDCPPNPVGTLIHSQSVDLALGTGAQTRTLTAASPNCRAAGWTGSKCFCDTCNDLNAEPCSSDADCPISGGNPGVCGGKRCLGGTNAGDPCVTGTDCPSGSCSLPGEATAPNACGDGVCTPNTPPDGDSSNEGVCAAGPVDGFCALESWRGCTTTPDCPLAGDACVPKNRECYPDNGVVGASVTAAGVASPIAPTLAAMYCGTPSGNSPTLNVLRSFPGLVRITLPGTATFGY